MLGITGVFRYYFYLSDDAHKFATVLDRVASAGFHYQDPDESIEKQSGISTGNWYYELEHKKSRVLIVQILGEGISAADSLGSLAEMESGTILNQNELLGQTTVLLSTELSWQDIVDNIQFISKRKIEYILPMQAGQMARFLPAGHQVYYACQPDSYDRKTARLLGYALPLIEARYIETRMTSNLLRDRCSIIERERAELEQNLSKILYGNLVKGGSGIKEVEELEEQIQELSLAYGMIAGNSNIISQGRCRLENSLKSLVDGLSQAPSLKLDRDMIDTISRPFLKRLDAMSNLIDMLRESRDGHQAAIDVVRSRIDIMNSRANIVTQEKIRDLMELNTSIQKQSLAFQFAAGLIEFIVLAYYSHSLWKNLAHNAYENVPSILQFIVVISFSGLTTYITHIVAEYLQGHTQLKKKILLAGIPLLILLLFVFLGTILTNGGAH